MDTYKPQSQSPSPGPTPTVDSIVLDVRPLLAAGTSPCQAIDAAVPRVPPHGTLVLLVPFEPVPLYDKLHARGFTHSARQLPDGAWQITFHREAAPSPTPVAPAGQAPATAAAGPATVPNPQPPCLQIDARHLEPPQPMVRVLEALEQLPEHGTLQAHTDRRPVHLLAQLHTRGCSARAETQPDGSCLTTIRRGPGSSLP